jgi:hypothetical protein
VPAQYWHCPAPRWRAASRSNRERTVFAQGFYAFKVRLRLDILRFRTGQRCLVTLNHRLGTFPLLNIVIQRGDFHCQLRLCLMDALTINTIVNLHQQVAFFTLAKS